MNTTTNPNVAKLNEIVREALLESAYSVVGEDKYGRMVVVNNETGARASIAITGGAR